MTTRHYNAECSHVAFGALAATARENLMPRVSVLMPVAEIDEYFEGALYSILNQTFADLEVIVALNGRASDQGAALRERYPDPRVTIVLCGLRQISYALNRAFDASSGEYLARMDADDISEPQRIAEQLALLDARPDIGVVGTQIVLIDDQGVALGTKRRRLPTQPDAIRRTQWWQGGVVHPSVMMRRAVLTAAGGYGGGVEDLDLWLRMRRAGVRFANIDKPLLRYRQHPNQITKLTRSRISSEACGLFIREAILTLDPRFLAGAGLSFVARFVGPRRGA
jgi:glycosyltransferase involved in cell wall biosynthesis